MATPAGPQFLQVIDSSGVRVGATCEYYNLSDVAQNVYSDAALTTSLGAVLNGGNATDAKGIFPKHFLDPSLSYKRIIKLSDGSTWRTDNPVQTASVASDTVGIVTSIATLQATTFGATPPALIAVISNTSAGDGGGLFRYDSTDTSSADNGTTIILSADSKRWKRQTLAQLFDIAVTNGWRLPSANTPTLYANSTAVAEATGAGGVVGADVTTPANARAFGFRGFPQKTELDSGNHTIVQADWGKTFYHTDANARTLTINSNANLALPVGFWFRIINGAGAANVTVAITTDTLQRLDGTAGTGSRTVGASSSVLVEKVASTTWGISGVYT